VERVLRVSYFPADVEGCRPVAVRHRVAVVEPREVAAECPADGTEPCPPDAAVPAVAVEEKVP
jgi:hypothetical protein